MTLSFILTHKVSIKKTDPNIIVTLSLHQYSKKLTFFQEILMTMELLVSVCEMAIVHYVESINKLVILVSIVVIMKLCYKSFVGLTFFKIISITFNSTNLH